VSGTGGKKGVNAGGIVGCGKDEPAGPRDHERKLLAPQVKRERRADPAPSPHSFISPRTMGWTFTLPLTNSGGFLSISVSLGFIRFADLMPCPGHVKSSPGCARRSRDTG